MNLRNLRLFLILVLLTIWADRLKIGAFYVTPRSGTTAFGQEAYPLSIRDSAETRDSVEAACLARIHSELLSIPLIPPRVPWSELDSVVFPIFSGSDACYLFMSIQR
jgi:hypothetical protein